MSAALMKLRPGEAAAAEALRTAALERYPEMRDRVSAMAKAVTEMRETSDLLLLMAAVDRVSLAAEALAGTAKAMHEAADAGLLKTMVESGCHGFASGYSTVSLRTNAPTVEILGDVPDEFLVARDPTPDRAAIRNHLQRHPGVNWARLHEGSTSLVRRST